MRRLKQVHKGQRAIVILGGPSLLEQRVDLAKLRRSGDVVLLESKALTPRFLASGLEPDYFLMPFPEKCKDNALQHVIFRSFLAGVNIRPCLKRAADPVLNEMRERFDRYFMPWRPERGIHKRYRWRPDVYLKDSPRDLLAKLPGVKLIADHRLLAEHFPSWDAPNPLYSFEQSREPEPFDVEAYYEPIERDGRLSLRFNNFLNSIAVVLCPLLRYMGFRAAYFVGMDMSMLGSMEYAALYTFRSMWHYRWFFWRSSRAFNGDYRMNRPFYLRPASEFEDLQRVMNSEAMPCVRVYEPFKYAAPMAGIRTVSWAEFFEEEWARVGDASAERLGVGSR